MPIETVGVFTINYTMFTRAPTQPDEAIQFGMNFTVTSTTGKPLAQLIFPATPVGTNKAGQWNVDNHQDAGSKVNALIFAGAQNGTITDGPKEIMFQNKGVKNTKFTVYILEIENNRVLPKGVTFGYSINTGDKNPQTVFTGLKVSTITNEEKTIMLQRCPIAKFS